MNVFLFVGYASDFEKWQAIGFILSRRSSYFLVRKQINA